MRGLSVTTPTFLRECRVGGGGGVERRKDCLIPGY